MTFPVPRFRSSLKILPFSLGRNSAPSRLNFPFSFWLDATEWIFLREGTQRADLDCHVTGPGRTAAAFKGNKPPSPLGAPKIVPYRTQVIKT